MEEVTLTECFELVGNYAFMNCTCLKKITFPKNVDVIKESDLESIDFKSLIIATDLSPLKEIQIDTSQIDIHRIGICRRYL